MTHDTLIGVSYSVDSLQSREEEQKKQKRCLIKAVLGEAAAAERQQMKYPSRTMLTFKHGN